MSVEFFCLKLVWIGPKYLKMASILGKSWSFLAHPLSCSKIGILVNTFVHLCKCKFLKRKNIENCFKYHDIWYFSKCVLKILTFLKRQIYSLLGIYLGPILDAKKIRKYIKIATVNLLPILPYLTHKNMKQSLLHLEQSE